MSAVASIRLARAVAALAHYRRVGGDPFGPFVMDALYAPAPKGLSLADAHALIEEGLGVIRESNGRQFRVFLTEAGKAARDGGS